MSCSAAIRTKDDDGRTHISIDHLPELPTDRRSLGGSLKLYFFKTYLKQDNVNQLRWIEYHARWLVSRTTRAVCRARWPRREARAAAGARHHRRHRRHGCRRAGACGLDQRFDLVLTYDYENLSTPIAETAQTLKAQLAAAGLRDERRQAAHAAGAFDGRPGVALVHRARRRQHGRSIIWSCAARPTTARRSARSTRRARSSTC